MPTMRPGRLALNAFALLTVSSLISSCSKNDNSTAPGPTPSYAEVMVVHASPDGPAVDLYIDDQLVVNRLAYPGNTGYLQVLPGVKNVAAKIAGTSTTLLAGPVPIQANTYYSVFAADSIADVLPILVYDTLTAPPSGMANIRFIHLCPNGPAVDVAVSSGATLFSAQSFTQHTSFVPVQAGTYDFDVRESATGSILFTWSQVSLQAGKIYTMFLRGFNGATGSQALGMELITNK